MAKMVNNQKKRKMAYQERCIKEATKWTYSHKKGFPEYAMEIMMFLATIPIMVATNTAMVTPVNVAIPNELEITVVGQILGSKVEINEKLNCSYCPSPRYRMFKNEKDWPNRPKSKEYDGGTQLPRLIGENMVRETVERYYHCPSYLHNDSYQTKLYTTGHFLTRVDFLYKIKENYAYIAMPSDTVVELCSYLPLCGFYISLDLTMETSSTVKPSDTTYEVSLYRCLFGINQMFVNYFSATKQRKYHERPKEDKTISMKQLLQKQYKANSIHGNT